MLLKLIGAGVLMLSGAVYAARRAREERAQLARIEGFYAMLLHIRAQIEMLCLPLDEIFGGMPPGMPEACGGGDTWRRGAMPTGDLLRAAGGICDGEAREALERVWERLGKGTREDQIRLCGGAAEVLAARREVLAREAARSERARGALVAAGCLAVVILLW